MGEDRTGLVESLSQLITAHDGNWLESRMCALGGKFTGIIRIHIPEDRARSLVQSLEILRMQNLTVSVQPERAESDVGPTKTAMLNLLGHDRPGIIHQISAALAHQGVNMEELETECTSAPMSGEMIFKAEARLQIPLSCVVSELRRELEKIGSELMVDISFSEI